jgi:hypothetical protein
MDGTRVPVVKKETAGRQGKGEDGQAKTRKAKLGCVFTQTGFDRKGRPVWDDDSTSYAGAIETAEVFGRWIYQEAMRRGMDSAGEAVVIGDGAAWIWNIADEQFYGATQIVDFTLVIKALDRKGRIPGYEKGSRYIFQAISDKLEKAILNAEKLENFHKTSQTDNPSTKVYKLVQHLKSLKR